MGIAFFCTAWAIYRSKLISSSFIFKLETIQNRVFSNFFLS